MMYRCPKCEGALSFDDHIVLIGEHEGRRTLFAFSQTVGDYRVNVADGEAIEPGTVWEFSCPLCGTNLTIDYNPRLARLEAVDGDEVRVVMFSKVASEQATFVLGGDKLESHGKDSGVFFNK